MSDNDHQHNAYDVYGLEDTQRSVRRAEAGVLDLVSLVNGLREGLAAAESRIGRLHERVQVLEAEADQDPASCLLCGSRLAYSHKPGCPNAT